MQLPSRHTEPAKREDVLLVLDQLDVGESGSDALQDVHGQAAGEAVGGLGVEAVLGVDHQRDPGQAGRDPSVDAGLGVVGVDDVGAEPTEQPVQLAEREHVLVGRAGPGGVTQRMVHDAVGLQGGDERSRCRRGVDLEAGVPERPQLGPEQQLEADVGGGDVEEPRHAVSSVRIDGVELTTVGGCPTMP